MKFLQDWNDYLKESLEFNSKKAEIEKKRNEIQDKISKIESELNFIQKDSTEQVPAETVNDVQVHELELKLESLRNELKDLDLL